MTLEELQDYLRKKLRTAYNLGQTYWQQADSEYRRDHKKSVETANKFCELIEHVVSAVTFEMNRASAAQESAPAELPPLPGCLADRLHEAIGIAHHRAQHAGSVPRMKKWDDTKDDLRAALSRPVVIPEDDDELAQWVENQGMQVAWANDGDMHHIIKVTPPELRVLLAAALPSPQPVAKVLTQAQIEPVATFEGYLDGGTPIIKWTGASLPAGAKLYSAPVAQQPQDERVAFEAWMSEEHEADGDMLKKPYEGRYFYAKPANMWDAWQARAILAASTPTTLTEKKE